MRKIKNIILLSLLTISCISLMFSIVIFDVNVILSYIIASISGAYIFTFLWANDLLDFTI